MSIEQIGAIIRIVYYLLKINDREKTWFSPEEIYAWYQPFKNRPEFKTFLAFKKINKKIEQILTLESVKALRNWLKLHIKTKEIFWFENENGKFRIIAKYQILLEQLYKQMFPL